MSAPKRAKVQIVTVEGQCPHCEGTLLDPETGSYHIFPPSYAPDQEFECEQCEKKSLLPMRLWTSNYFK